jgi:hypothetical protein
MRYPMRLDATWRPLLLVGGATATNSYVETSETNVRFRFGVLTDETVPRSEIAGAERMRWHWLGGVGWRLAWRGVGLIGARRDVVRVQLSRRRRVRILVPSPIAVDWIAVSVLDPDALIAELSPRV